MGRISDMDRANLVFHHAVFCKLVAVGCRFLYPLDGHAEFVLDSSLSRIDIGLIESGVATTAVRPGEGPCFFPVTPLLEKEFFVCVEDEGGKGPMQGRVRSMHFAFWHGSQDVIVLVDEDDEFRLIHMLP